MSDAAEQAWNDPDPAHIIEALRSGKISVEYDPQRSPLINAYIKQVSEIFAEAEQKRD